MNLLPLYRDHPDLAEVVLGPPVHLASCHDCGLHYPTTEMQRLILDVGCVFVCGDCTKRRQDVAWTEWLDRLAKEGRGSL